MPPLRLGFQSDAFTDYLVIVTPVEGSAQNSRVPVESIVKALRFADFATPEKSIKLQSSCLQIDNADYTLMEV